MTSIRLTPKNVAVVGAGVSGVAAAVHLKRAGLDVTVFERSSQAGGIWVYNPQSAKDAAYPSTVPSAGDAPEFEKAQQHSEIRQDSPLRDVAGDPAPINTAGGVEHVKDDLSLSFAPPGPCYVALKNNVSTIEMETTLQAWKPGTEEFVPHHVLGDYIQDAARANDIEDLIQFNTRVTNVVKEGTQWRVDVAQRLSDESGVRLSDSTELFDALVVATGHYHACNIPDLPGLADWKRSFPNRVWHSKLYRTPGAFKGQNVLLVGAGVSSLDIAKDLGGVAAHVFQSSRGGMYDLPSHLLPDNTARVSGVASFEPLQSSELGPDGSIPGIVTLATGEKLCNIHQVILCTGYHVSFPFMRQYHADGVRPEDAGDDVLVSDGQTHHNLHKDIFYIQDPSLAFIGVPYHTATYTAFEFGAMAVAAVFSGQMTLPSQAAMREEYRERVKRKGAGRTLHSLKGNGEEPEYVRGLAAMVNEQLPAESKLRIVGHTMRWLEAYERRCKRREILLSGSRDPAIDRKVIEEVASAC